MEKMDLIPSSLYGLDNEELGRIVKEKGLPAYRASQLADWVYKKHIASFAEAKNLAPALREALEKNHQLFTLRLMEVAESSNKESSKYLFRTHDGQLIESVLITQQDRRTVCVSTQIGCKIGCIFCASGKGKFGRNLTPGEIVEQVAWVERRLKSLQERHCDPPRSLAEKQSVLTKDCFVAKHAPRKDNHDEKGREGSVTNIVFMGMGEPLDNFEATMKALKILQAPWGFALGARRITVSTSGITPKIVEFVKRSEGRVRLSISLHSSDDAKRSELVPINKKYSLEELKKTLTQIHSSLKRDITFEYTLISGMNDSKEEAEGVARLARPLQAKVNIIPYNPIKEMDLKTPTREQIEKFVSILESRGVRVIVRQTAGRDISAACGQLARVRAEGPGR